MSDLTAVRATWGFLQTLHPLFLFAETLPTVDGADQVQQFEHGDSDGDSSSLDDVEHLKNEITRLRSGLRLNIVKTQLVDIYELSEDDPAEGLQDLEAELHIMLDELEQLVDPRALKLDLESSRKPEGPTALEGFPKLVALRGRLRESEAPSAHEDTSTASLGDETDLASMQAISSWSQRYSPASIAIVAGLIRYPQDVANIETFRKTVSRFGKALDRVLGDMAGFWKMEAQTLDYTPRDVETIENAHSFASASTSLFGHMTEGCKRCEMPHQAKLHLSGFKEDTFRISISSCEEGADWVSAIFTCSSQEPSCAPTRFENLCLPLDDQLARAHVEIQQVVFNSTGMWTSQQTMMLEQHLSQPKHVEQALDQLLADRDRLTPKYRKLAEVLLAACIFQLNESPWTEQYLRPDYLYVPPLDKKRLHQWCPRLLCDLVPQDVAGQQSDNIAAFGVLVLELEAHRRAAWTGDDEDWLTGVPSNSIRLARVLKDWEDSVSDDYRRIAKACLDFESLIQKLDHPEITLEKKGLAVIYKCILEPLFRHMTTTFEDLTPLFTGMFGRSRGLTAAMEITAEGTAKRLLFDDDDGATKREDQLSAAKFLTDLKPFLRRIKDLFPNSNRLHFPTHEKVRIAVLDSGASEEDPIIWQAIKYGRISSKSKSFVGRPGDWMVDGYGHGTHVARLLLECAPAAEIFVAKICTAKVINNESMPGIAAAINWAVEEVDAHIISMSFGFEDDHDEIDDALDGAIDAGKLVIAAASNNGGLSGRARPARQEDVICMHATDGKGNKGLMNPSPLPKDDNFATLGVAVPSKWEGESVCKSGTSFAVPVAVGFAAAVLELARFRCGGAVKQRKMKMLYRKKGMAAVMRRMAEERDGYDFVHPDRLARDWTEERAVGEAARVIEGILADLS